MARFASVVDRVTLGLRWHEVPSDDRHDDRGDLAQSQFGGVEQHLDAPTGEVDIGAQNVPAGSHAWHRRGGTLSISFRFLGAVGAQYPSNTASPLMKAG